MNNNYTCYEEGCSLPSSPNELEILVRQLKREVESLTKTTEGKLLCHDGKIAEMCLYIKNNLSNSLRELVDSMYSTGELGNIINEIVLNELKMMELKIDYFINVKEYGAVGDGKTDDTNAIQRVINESNYVYIPEGVYCFTKLKLKSDLVIMGDNTTLKCLDVSTSGNDASITPVYKNNKIENVRIEGITFEGNKEKISHEYYDVIGFFANNDEQIKNITIANCYFKNFKEDAIRFMYSINADISNISIKGCNFDGITNEKPSLNGIRFVMNSYDGTYGYYPVNNVYIHDCKGEMIRTLADIKRGCQNVIVSDCFTHNMNDCHNSIDGSKNVILTNIVSSMDEDFNPTTGTNFIEIQGEDITVKNVIGEGSFKVRDGLQVTDYGHPDEKNDLGHNSKNIIISQCLFKNITRNGYNIMNGNNIKVSECSIENAGVHSYAFVSGDGRSDSSGNKLKAGLNHLVNSNDLNCTYGLTAKNMINDDVILKVENVKNENGYLNLYASDVLNTIVVDIVKNKPINLNPELEMTDSNVNHYKGTNVTCESTEDKNTGSYYGVKLTDSLDTKLGELECNCKFKAKKDDVFTFVVNAKKDTGYFSVEVKEYNGSTWLSNTFISSLQQNNNWNEFVGQCKIQNENTTHVLICLVPAAGYNNPSATGTLYVSGFEVYKM